MDCAFKSTEWCAEVCGHLHAPGSIQRYGEVWFVKVFRAKQRHRGGRSALNGGSQRRAGSQASCVFVAGLTTAVALRGLLLLRSFRAPLFRDLGDRSQSGAVSTHFLDGTLGCLRILQVNRHLIDSRLQDSLQEIRMQLSSQPANASHKFAHGVVWQCHGFQIASRSIMYHDIA